MKTCGECRFGVSDPRNLAGPLQCWGNLPVAVALPQQVGEMMEIRATAVRPVCLVDRKHPACAFGQPKEGKIIANG